MAISKSVSGQLASASWVRKMFDAASEMRSTLGSDAILDFSLGNPVVEPPEAFLAAIRTAADAGNGAHRYMNNAGYPETRAAVASYLSGVYGISYSANHILMSCGAAGGLNVVLKSILDPEDEVLALSPYFPEYGFYVDHHGGRIRYIESDDQFQPDPDRIEAAITEKTKAIIINSPNNPTGTVYAEPLLKQLAGVLSAGAQRIGHPIYLIADDIYRRIVFDDAPLPSLPKIYRDTIVVSSWSKDLSIPGERLGFIAISPQASAATEMVDACTMLTRTLGFVNASALMQRAIVDCLNVCVDVSSYRENRDIICDALGRAGFRVTIPAGAFYVFPECPTPDDIGWCERLRKKGIIAVPGTGFGRKGHIRVAYSVSRQTCERAAVILSAGI